MYLERAKTLTDGLKKHLDVVSSYGISQDELSKLEETIREAEQFNEEIDRRRAELNVIVPKANKILAEIKITTNDLKRIVKPKIEQTRWMDYGIPDKR